MKRKTLKKIIAALCATAMSIPMAAASVGAIEENPVQNGTINQQEAIFNAQTRMAKAYIAIFFDKLERELQRNTSEANFLDSTWLKTVTDTSDSLNRTQYLLNKLDNANLENLNLEEGDIKVCNSLVRDFAKYMRDRGTMGNLNQSKFENVKERSNELGDYLVYFLNEGAD